MGRLPPKEGICRKTAKTVVLTSSHSHWQTGLRSKAYMYMHMHMHISS